VTGACTLFAVLDGFGSTSPPLLPLANTTIISFSLPFVSAVGKDFASVASSNVIRFVSIGAKIGICTVVGPNGTLVEAEIRTFKCPKSVF
jgi:hypothetical protein